MVRAMFLDYPNDYTLGTATRYQFLYGPYVLVALVYQNTQADADGNDVRNGIYLPEGNWIDYFTGDLYQADGFLIILRRLCGNFHCLSNRGLFYR